MVADVARTFRVGASPVSFGRFSYGLEHITIRQWGEGAALTIGAFCSIANITVFLGGNHRVDWITTFPFGHVYQDELGEAPCAGHPATGGDVVIGNDVWIAHGATIVSGVSIGDGAVIAANAHVARDVAPYEVVGGNPARVLRKRFDDETIGLLLELRWWDLPTETIRGITHVLSAPPSAAAIGELIRLHRPGAPAAPVTGA